MIPHWHLPQIYTAFFPTIESNTVGSAGSHGLRDHPGPETQSSPAQDPTETWQSYTSLSIRTAAATKNIYAFKFSSIFDKHDSEGG